MQVGVINEIKPQYARSVPSYLAHGTDHGAGQGVNASKGYVTSKLVAEALGLLSQDKAFVAL